MKISDLLGLAFLFTMLFQLSNLMFSFSPLESDDALLVALLLGSVGHALKERGN